jgi:hypothetical protein
MHLGRFRAGTFLALLLCGAMVTGCVVREPRPVVVAEVVAPRRPPPERVEVRPAPPAPFEVVEWRPGHWRWDGRDWDWVPGAWIEKPHRAATWVPGHWDERGGERWVWVEGRWR